MMKSQDDISWYHGKQNRDEAEETLLSEGTEDGRFLVRESSTSPGNFVLSVVDKGVVVHFPIRSHGNDALFSIANEKGVIHGLDTLIELHRKSQLGNVPLLTTMCKKDSPPNECRKHGSTNLLHRATKEGNYMIVCEMLRSGYRNIDSKNQEGQSAAHLACKLGKDEILKMLIGANANVNMRDSAGNTPLHYAAEHNNPTTIRILVNEADANIQARNVQTGWVPLHSAAFKGNTECIKVLLSFDAPCKPRNMKGETPADVARQHKNHECAQLLENYIPPHPKTSRSEWYYGRIGRNDAEMMLKVSEHQLLNPAADDGSQMCNGSSLLNGDSASCASLVTVEKDMQFARGLFLVRKSFRRSTGYVLSVISGGRVYHYEIQKSGSHFSVDDGPLLESLEHLISHYQKFSDGLPTVLCHPSLKPSATLSGGSMDKVKSTSCCEINPSKLNVNSNPSNFGSLDRISKTNQHHQHASGCSSHALGDRHVRRKIIIESSVDEKENLQDDNCNNMNTGALKKEFRSKSIPSQEEILYSRIKLGAEIGEGEFGTVYKATYTTQDGITYCVAVKTLHEEFVNSAKEEFLSEARVMMELKHHCIVRLIGICHSPLLMLQELVEHGSLLKYLILNESKISLWDLELWAAQIASGMHYLESQRYVHRDLAARNILLSDPRQVKISDFGLSRTIDCGRDYYKASKGGRWPVKWYAPESVNFGTFSHLSDVWSYGITLWEMYSFGEQPYGDMKGVDVVEYIEAGRRLAQTEKCPDKIYQIMKRCWSYKPEVRPSFQNLLDEFAASTGYLNIEDFVKQREIR